MMNQEKLKGHLLILAANILFAINMPVSKYLLPEHVQPEALTSMRMSFACVMFWITSLFVPYEKVPLKDLGLLCLCALCGVGLNQGLFIWGLNTTSPVDASIIATAVPIFVMILAALILKEPITRMKTFGVLLGICGAISLILQSTQGSNQASSLGGNLIHVLDLFGSIQASNAQVLIRHDDEMDVPVLHADYPAFRYRIHLEYPGFPQRGLRRPRAGSHLLRVIRGHVRTLFINTAGLKANPPDYRQHVQLYPTDRSFLYRRMHRSG